MRHLAVLLTTFAACAGKEAHDTSPNASDQAETAADVASVAAARRALVADGALSIRGKMATVIVQRGVATLRGRVHDEDERRRAIGDVMRAPGVSGVIDRIEVEVKEAP